MIWEILSWAVSTAALLIAALAVACLLNRPARRAAAAERAARVGRRGP
jgi:hypothetical protein